MTTGIANLGIWNNISPGSLPASATSKASIPGLVPLHGTQIGVAAHFVVTGTPGSNVFARIQEVNSAVTVASSQVQLPSTVGGGNAFLTMSCLGMFDTGGSSATPGTVPTAFELDVWTDGTASIGASSGWLTMSMLNIR